MSAGGIGSMRLLLSWGTVQPERGAQLDWSGVDSLMAVTASHGIEALPTLFGLPAWAGDSIGFPIDNERQRRGWRRFVRAAAERYGPGGAFWREHGPDSAEPLPEMPVRAWQLWNEPNYFYFADPVSPPRYARFVRLTRGALSGADPGARLVLGGLFADPKKKPGRTLDAPTFLERLYESDGIAAEFDGIGLHPYARDTARLRELVEEVRAVADEHGDSGASLYITEMGWGSEPDSEVSFEVGPRGQARELRDAYEYLTAERERLKLAAVYWFSWKDFDESCSFCDSAGLFEEGAGFEAKPAWEAFVEVAGGRAAP